MFGASLFSPPKPSIPADAKVVIVADLFASDYAGGAELTTEALIQTSPFKCFKMHSKDVTMETLKEGIDKFWVFGNFASLDFQLIPSIVANLKYAVLEYDYKYCEFRSPEKHMHETGLPCDCQNKDRGKWVSAFYYGAMGLFWMSEKQKERYTEMFPFLLERDNIVLSSVFDPTTLGTVTRLNEKYKDVPRKGWVVLGSSSWIKGFDAAKKWCETKGLDHEVVWNLPYEHLLEKLASSEGFVYLPMGGDTCPRMCIEAKLLGCKLHINDNVENRHESWFDTDDLGSIQDYLYVAPKIFWNATKKLMDYSPTISGYATTYNCVKQSYPFEECIKSMLGFCDEVCVVDGGSTDNTWETLLSLQETNPSLKLKRIERDWESKRSAVFDGMQKAEARAMCTKEFCWQMDVDEVVHVDDFKKARDMCKILPREVDILALPVIEYWGSYDKVRVDVTPWKWRLSRNKPNITHGIPKSLRLVDNDGNAYAAPGTDGCDMVDAETGEPLPHVSFYTPEADACRQAALMGNPKALNDYQAWFNAAVNQLPTVFHYSWLDIERKMKLYRDFWQKHWGKLWDSDTSDTPENNMFFDAAWKDVTDEMIKKRAGELSSGTGGWVFHRKWTGQTVPNITTDRKAPI